MACGMILALTGPYAADASPRQRGASGNENAERPAAETATIEGSVTKTGTGQPIRGARLTLRRAEATAEDALEFNPTMMTAPAGVTLGVAGRGFLNPAAMAGGAASASTDAMGRYTLSNVAPGEYRLIVEAEGHVRQEYGQRTAAGPGIPFTFAAGKRVAMDFQLAVASVITGRVFDPEGEPLIKTTVQAYTYRYTNGRRTLTPVATAQTNDLGEYRLYWIPPGEYFVAVMPRGGFSGTNIPPTGTPGAGARNVQFFTAGGDGQVATFQMTEAAGASDAIYYPGVANPQEAAVIRVSPSRDALGIDFHLRPLRTVTVSGRVVASFSLAPAIPTIRDTVIETPPSPPNPPAPGTNAQAGVLVGRGVSVPRLAGRVIGGPPVELTLTRAGAAQSALGPFAPGAAQVRPDGTFEIGNVTAGSYILTAIAKDPAGLQHTARMAIEVAGDNVRDLVLALQPGHDVRGRINVDPPAPDSFKMTNLRVTLVPESSPIVPPPTPGGDFVMAVASPRGVFPGGDSISATVEEDGSFLLKDVAVALQYRVQVTGISGGGYLVKGQFGSSDALGAPLSGAESDASLQLQIGFAGGTVSGTVMDAGDKPYAAAVVALVPDKNRSGRSDLYFSTTSGTDGKYQFINVPPGAYRLFTWTEIPSGAFRYPDFLKDYEDRAVPGAIDKRGAWTETLRVTPIER
jgi:protocatechuate 3,4-dioxygenase beta subunit